MGIQYENVTVTITGANPQTLTVAVPVDISTGTGTATFSYTGSNSGTDTLQGAATLAGTGYTSNSAQVNWQSTNGNIQLDINNTFCYAWGDSPMSGPVASYIWGGTGSGIPRTITSSGVTSLSGTSLAFDYYTTSGSIASGVGNGSDPVWATYNSAGSFTSYQFWPPYTENFNCIILTNILVPAPGYYTMTLTYKDGSMWGIGNNINTGSTPTWMGQGTFTGDSGQTATANSNFPLLYAPPMSSGEDGYTNTASTAVYYPEAGVYPVEIDWDYWYHSGRILHVTANSAELAPVSLLSPPPSSTPTGNLTITPAGGATNLQVAGQPITLTVNVSGIVYTSMSYCPVLEGQTGLLNIYNATNAFNFQTYNGDTVSKPAAVTAGVFTLSATDNSAYQGLFSVGFDGTNFNLNYNGNTANSNSSSRVLSSNLVVEAEDVAWYDNSDTSFDLFTGSSGGTAYSLVVEYMNNPSVSSLSPTTLNADGGSHVLAISLNKALSPEQQGALNTGNTINASCTVTGATSTGTPTAVLDSGGWLTGWNVPFVVPYSNTNVVLTVNLTVSGTLTYLSGNTFVTNTVTYISGSVGSITATGVTYQAPAPYSYSVSPTPGYTFNSESDTTTPASITLTAVAFVPGTDATVVVDFTYAGTFYYNFSDGGSGTTPASGVVSPSNPTTSASATVGGVSGYLHTATVTVPLDSILPVPSGDYFSGSGSYYEVYGGFTATEPLSGLYCTYTSSTLLYYVGY